MLILAVLIESIVTDAEVHVAVEAEKKSPAHLLNENIKETNN